MGMGSCHHKTPRFHCRSANLNTEGFQVRVGGQRNGRQHLLGTPTLSNSTYPYPHVKWAMLGGFRIGSISHQSCLTTLATRFERVREGTLEERERRLCKCCRDKENPFFQDMHLPRFPLCHIPPIDSGPHRHIRKKEGEKPHSLI